MHAKLKATGKLKEKFVIPGKATCPHEIVR